jgi:hypothetical protein
VKMQLLVVVRMMLWMLSSDAEAVCWTCYAGLCLKGSTVLLCQPTQRLSCVITHNCVDAGLLLLSATVWVWHHPDSISTRCAQHTVLSFPGHSPSVWRCICCIALNTCLSVLSLSEG